LIVFQAGDRADPVAASKSVAGVAENQQRRRRFLSLGNSQGVVSLECHSVAAIGFGLRIFRDGGSRL
jgi:hypothetical protein